MTTVVLYGRDGCCLCDDARAVLERVRAGASVRARRSATSRPTTRCCAAYLERIPVVTIDGVEAFELFVDESELDAPAQPRTLECTRMSYTVGRGTETGSARRRQAGREAVARGRRAAVALPAGPHPGPQDGQGDDLLPGAGRLHPRQLDPDPPRPVGLRQVRQARGRLQRRVAGHPDPQDPAHLGPAQHRAVRRRPPRAPRSPPRTSSPTTASASSRCSTSTRARWATGSAR